MTRAFTSSAGQGGFTFLELAVVIIVLAILVAIAVPVYMNQSSEASEKVAENNHRVGCHSLNKVYFEILDQGEDKYIDPDDENGSKNWAKYMSQKETRATWARAWGNGASMCMAAIFKDDVRLGAYWGDPDRFNWSVVGYGKIGTYRGYVDDSDRWVRSYSGDPDEYEYMSVITVCEKGDRAFFTSYKQGIPLKTGTFIWENGTGSCSAFEYL